MPVIQVSDERDPRLEDYRHVPDPELLRRGEIFVAEGREVVRTLVSRSPYAVRSVLLTETAWRSLAEAIEPYLSRVSVYLVPPGLVEGITGYNIHRGCLAIGERPAPQSVAAWLEAAGGAAAGRQLSPTSRLVVLEGVGNADNMGGIFRNAAAFGADAVALGPRCCDPLYRKAIRVSMGAALRVPFVLADEGWPMALEDIKGAGFQVLALTPRPDAVDLAVAASTVPVRVALLAGCEGDGLTSAALAASDRLVRIPMAAGTDSLNVATAVGIALQRFFSDREAIDRRQ